MNISGVLMAGGESTRMRKDKGLVSFKGKPMAQYGIELLKQHFKDCIVNTNNPAYSIFDLPLINDIHHPIGPLGGLHTALACIDCEYIFLMGCDLPNLNSDIIKYLLLNLNNEDIVLPFHSPNQLEPFCGLYSKRLLPSVEQMILKHNYKMHDLITSANTRYVNVDDLLNENPDMFLNVNTPSQLE